MVAGRGVRVWGLAFLALAAAAGDGAGQGRPMRFEDLAALKEIRNVELAPDGRRVAYVLTTGDFAAGTVRNEIVIAPVAGGVGRTVGEGVSPRWSPDGRWLAFRGREAGRSGILLYDVTAEARRFLVAVEETDHFLGRVEKNLEWSPDGRWLAYVGSDRPAPAPQGIRVFERILYKTRTGFSDNRRSHVYVVPAAGGEPRLLTPGDYDEHSIAWSPDSRRIAFASNRSVDPDDDHSDDLWTVDVATGEVERLTETPATEYAPTWSPDGRSIAYRGNVRPKNTKDSSPEESQLFVLDLAGRRRQSLTASFDRRVSALRWAPDGRSVYFMAPDRGTVHVYAAALDGTGVRQVTRGDLQVLGYSLDAGGRTIAYVGSSVRQPPEVWVTAATGAGEPRPVTRVHREFVERVALQGADTFWFASFDGTPVQGWVMRPLRMASGRRYPLILAVHGGPHGMYGYGFSEQFQLLTAAGYGVLFVNPRGSTGYGQRFADGTLLNWGGGDYRDLMAGVDEALRRHPWADADRLGVMGGSYGGYMTNWIITQTDRFKAAVVRAGVSNLVSFYGTSIYPDLLEVEFGGNDVLWNRAALLWNWSPLAHVRDVRTPTLFLHGENDHDVPFSQAEEMYIALKKLRVPAVLVRYAGEGHGIRRPDYRLDMYRRTQEWFDRYLRERAGVIDRTSR